MDDVRLEQLAQLLLDDGYADNETDAREAARRILAAMDEHRRAEGDQLQQGQNGPTADDGDKGGS